MQRSRLTITLKKDLISQVDKYIDGAKIRNRSHAIEFLLQKSLKPKIKQALILAGGKGINMRPFTYEMPKALIPVKGRPLLEYTVNKLRDNNIRNITILVGYLGDKIKNHFGDGSKFGVNIKYLEEKKEIGTAKAILLAEKMIQNEPFLIIYGDVLANIDYSDFIDFHIRSQGTASAALTSIEDPTSFGMINLKGTKIVKFTEKPAKDNQLSRLISAGIYIAEPDIFNYIPSKRYSMLENDVFPKLAKEDRLYGYPFEGQWYDVGTPKIYERVLKEWDQ